MTPAEDLKLGAEQLLSMANAYIADPKQADDDEAKLVKLNERLSEAMREFKHP